MFWPPSGNGESIQKSTFKVERRLVFYGAKEITVA
jgi:hypothetical protein